MPLTSLLTLAALLFLAVAGKYVLGPVMVRERHRRSADPVYQPIDISQAPPEVATPLQQASQALSAIGFRVIGHVFRKEEQSPIDSYASILASPDGADIAELMAIRVSGPRARVVSAAVFRREFADDTCVATSNSSQASSTPSDPRVEGLRLSQVSDVVALYEVHRQYAARQAAGRTPRTPAPGSADRYFREQTLRSLQRLVEQGYYRLGATGRQYCPTMKGACLMVWRQLWPLKQIVAQQELTKTEAALRSLGLGGLRELSAGRSIVGPASPAARAA